MNPELQNCPHCQRPLPPGEQNQLVWCPACGCDLQLADATTTRATSSRARWGRLAFWLALLAPALTLALVTSRDSLASKGDFLLQLALVLSGVSGLVCGGWLAWRITQRIVVRVLLFPIFGVLFYAFSFFLCWLGCVAGSGWRN